MTHIEAMKQALEALHNITGWKSEAPQTIWYQAHEAITSLRQAIATEESLCASRTATQEPVAVVTGDAWNASIRFLPEGLDLPIDTLLYTHPPHRSEDTQQSKADQEPKREWVGLTDEDLSVCDEDGIRLARYWEAKLKEKNT